MACLHASLTPPHLESCPRFCMSGGLASCLPVLNPLLFISPPPRPASPLIHGVQSLQPFSHLELKGWGRQDGVLGRARRDRPTPPKARIILKGQKIEKLSKNTELCQNS